MYFILIFLKKQHNVVQFNKNQCNLFGFLCESRDRKDFD